MVLSAPQVLLAFRAACGPAMFALACFGFAGPLLAGLLLAGFLSDVFDGVVARRQGVATPMLRYADTLIDTFFYLAAAVAMRVSVPQVFAGVRLVVVALIIVHVSRTTFELTKYGRIASYHMWSSRALGILMVTAMTAVFVTGRPNALVTVTLWFAIANELEGFAASAILATWRTDVPTVRHAWRQRRGATSATS